MTPMALRTPRTAPRATQDDDVLMEISPRVYVSILVGEEIGRDGNVRCPFHDGGVERTRLPY